MLAAAAARRRRRERDAHRVGVRDRRRVRTAATTATSTSSTARCPATSAARQATASTTAAGAQVDAEHLRQRIDLRDATRGVSRCRLNRRKPHARRIEQRANAIRRRIGRRRAVGARREQSVRNAIRRIGEDRGRAHDVRLLRMRERDLDDLDAEVRVVRVPGVVVAARELLGRTNARRARDVDVDVLVVARIVHDRVRVRAAAGLHVGDVLRIIDVRDVEDSKSAHTIRLTVSRGASLPQSRRAVGASARDEEQILIDRHIALRRRADLRERGSAARSDSRCPRSRIRCSCPG